MENNINYFKARPDEIKFTHRGTEAVRVPNLKQILSEVPDKAEVVLEVNNGTSWIKSDITSIRYDADCNAVVLKQEYAYNLEETPIEDVAVNDYFKSIWHRPQDLMPEVDSEIFIYCKDNTQYLSTYQGEGKCFLYPNWIHIKDVKRWCYIKDILPKDR